MSDVRVIVAGASGYAGALAAQLVYDHPRLDLYAATSRSEAGTRLDRLHPRYRVPVELTELDLDMVEEVDAAIVAYPSGASVSVVAAMRGLGVPVVDLSADFRLQDVPTYQKWYGDHGDPDLLVSAVYGLTELDRDEIRDADLVANPGCYPTAALLALAPLAERGGIESVLIDAKSGVSGAGRGAGERASFVNLTENMAPYGVEGHRHQPEIEQGLRRITPAASSQGAPATGDPAEGRIRPGAAGSWAGRVAFVPHLLPLDQGLLASCYVDLAEPLGAEALTELYAARYADEPFVEVVDTAPGVREVRDTNVCRIHAATLGPDKAAIFAAIDNLWKGASGQAVQNLNLMLGFEETEGLR